MGHFNIGRNNWGCATSRAFREVALPNRRLRKPRSYAGSKWGRSGRDFIHHHRTVRAVTAPTSLRRYSVAMRRNLKRYYGAGDLHFITRSGYRRQPLLATPRRRDLFLAVLEQVRRRYQFVVAGYVVMPEHIHRLIGEPQLKTPSTVMQALKLGFARRVIAEARRLGVPHFSRFEAVKKPRLKILTRSTANNLPFRWLTNDVYDLGIHFGSPENWSESVG